MENGYTLTPLMLQGMAGHVAKNIFNVGFTYKRVLQCIRDSSLGTDFQTVFYAYRDEQDSVSLYLYAHGHMRDKVWSSELDTLLVLMVYGINVVIISNVPENSVIIDLAYQLEECLGRSFKYVETLWLYLHWHPDPMCINIAKRSINGQKGNGL
jgi:hypothetical protein